MLGALWMAFGGLVLFVTGMISGATIVAVCIFRDPEEFGLRNGTI